MPEVGESISMGTVPQWQVLQVSRYETPSIEIHLAMVASTNHPIPHPNEWECNKMAMDWPDQSLSVTLSAINQPLISCGFIYNDMAIAERAGFLGYDSTLMEWWNVDSIETGETEDEDAPYRKVYAAWCSVKQLQQTTLQLVGV